MPFVPFINADFLLEGETARRLFHTYAERQPIIDYHCHLPPGDLADNRRFANLFEIWLAGDHYKWRAMRTNGINERFCTGDASPYEKFLAWARTVPYTLRNPLYHWTHLELVRYFGIQELLNEETAADIWRRANERLKEEELSTQGILREFRVRVLCTTNDPAESLEDHKAIAAQRLPFAVLPAYRPDRAFRTDDPKEYNAWLDQLGAAANVQIVKLSDLL